ncbi:MAG: hypothetical protein IPJ65_40375 [Archangiaceae bacterium]|nr:hypothetical protein [Archangiaceae bacterium]
MTRALFGLVVLGCACESAPAASLDLKPAPVGVRVEAARCESAVLGFDPARAERGRVALLETGLTGPLVPMLAMQSLWAVWGTGMPADYWVAFRARYGFGLGEGVRAVNGNQATLDCLACHQGTVNGQSLVGLGNPRSDLTLLQEDLAQLATMAGFTPPGYARLRTGARGVNDAMGLGLELSLNYGTPPTPIRTELGFQDPPAWWGLKRKSRMFTDGSGDIRAHRSMMATLLAFGVTQAELEAREETFKDVREYLLSLSPPAWPFAAPAAEAVTRGRAVFEATCARCHGTSRCDANPSTLVALTEVGTDPVRASAYGPDEVAWVNLGWLARDYPETSTGAYVAPPLRGVWATAPYFHNGSVPTLAAVLESSTRPKVFELEAGADDYDAVAVGRKYASLAAAPSSPPRAERSHVYDTTRPGLSNAGHTFGDGLSAADRADLLEFLKQY